MIDPGGPVDPALTPQPVDDVDRPAAFTLMTPGWYPPADTITQAYGFCFTPDGLVVLVQLHDGFWTLKVVPRKAQGESIGPSSRQAACHRRSFVGELR